MGAISPARSTTSRTKPAGRSTFAARVSSRPTAAARWSWKTCDSARRRGARIYAEVLAVAAGADGDHLPQPSAGGSGARHAQGAWRRAASVPNRSISSAPRHLDAGWGCQPKFASIKEVFGRHAYRLKVNAPKSMLGHTCWAAAVVEADRGDLADAGGRAAPVHQHRRAGLRDRPGRVPGASVAHPVEYVLKNSFGFGGVNCVSVVRRWDG